MDKLSSNAIILLMLQLSVILAASRLMAELARKFRQPAVVGEILAGILLGPTLLGTVFPDVFSSIFPMDGTAKLVLDGFTQVAVVLLLFIAGLEVDLHIVWQQGKQALYVSFFSLIIPFLAGFAVCFYAPDFFGVSEGDSLVFSLFMATIMGMTALPVIARILMDLTIFKSRMGMLIVASAMIVDLICWLIFTVILSMMGTNHHASNVGQTIALTTGFAVLMLTLGRGLLNRALPWINKKMAWPGGLLSLSLALCFLAAAFTEYIGIHAIFGAFIIGVALGDSEHLSERAKEIVHQFINNIFAPIFFVSIGLYINVWQSFNLTLVLVILTIAFISKTLGASLGARLGGLNTNQSLAVGMGMNTHGTLEIILGTLALQAGLIEEEIFVAILIMVVVTILV
jgi:Kef-type K+ transport system membrane component KefB